MQVIDVHLTEFYMSQKNPRELTEREKGTNNRIVFE